MKSSLEQKGSVESVEIEDKGGKKKKTHLSSSITKGSKLTGSFELVREVKLVNLNLCPSNPFVLVSILLHYPSMSLNPVITQEILRLGSENNKRNS